VRKQQLTRYLRESEVLERFLPVQKDPSAELEQKEMESKLQQAVQELPEKQKAVFVLRYFDELPYDEISQILKTSVGGLKANYFHALKKIQEYMKHEI
jgi:RNA polymerase sigma-70 factor (ECF subfamily)